MDKNMRIKMEQSRVRSAAAFRRQNIHTFKSAQAHIKTKIEKMGKEDYEGDSVYIKGVKKFALTKDVELDSQHKNLHNPQPRNFSSKQLHRPCFLVAPLPVGDLHS